MRHWWAYVRSTGKEEDPKGLPLFMGTFPCEPMERSPGFTLDSQSSHALWLDILSSLGILMYLSYNEEGFKPEIGP